jgi:hypothetical protein
MQTRRRNESRQAFEIARYSPTCATEVRVVLESALRGRLEQVPKDLGKLLEFKYELLVEASQRVDDSDIRLFLESIAVGGKTGAMKKKLLAL